MNYYNPYFYSIPTNLSTPKVGLFTRLLGGSGFSLGKILSGTERALNFANQAIPLVKQVSPMIGNAKTMFKVMNEFKKTEKPIQTTNDTIIKENNINSKIENTIIDNNVKNNYESNNDGPTFFI